MTAREDENTAAPDAALWRMGAAQLADAIRTKAVAAREVIRAHLARIEAVNPAVNGVTVLLADEALAAADAADRAVASGHELGPLHGVPITVKENIDVVGSATTQGVVALKDALPPLDAPHVTQLKAAGAIIVGRTNLPDFGLRYHTDNALRGATVNPWDSARTPGGSSGGDAAALATGMAPLGMGNDYGGSVRWPAQCCGIASLRPTFGRVPRASSLPPEDRALTGQLFSVNGPMARHVRDLRLALSCMSGPDARDPWWTPAPLAGPELHRPVRVALTIDPAGEGVDPDVAAGVRRAADALSRAGYAIEEMEPPMVPEARELFARLVTSELALGVYPSLKGVASQDALRFLDLSFEAVPRLDYEGYVESFASLHAIARAWNLFLDQYPLVLGPVATMQPFPVGFDITGRDAFSVIMRHLRLTVAVNLLGLPAVVVPVGVANGLPQAVQIIGRRYREDVCLDAAEAVEERLGALTPMDPR